MRANRYHKKDYKRLYEIYHGIKKRCYNENCKRYKDYGGRGIKMCDEWLNGGIDVFIDWALTHGYQDDLTIDRKDNDGDYSPDNCRWATYSEQARNTRNAKLVSYMGEEKPLADWCEELNLCYDTMHNRICERGWKPEKAFTTKSKQEDSLAKKCREHNIKASTVRDRVFKLGWDLERALNTPSLGRGANQKSYA